MPLVICGIDEAGYGPLLGPLCVAMSAVRIDDWSEGDPAPDLWKRLSPAVARAGAPAARGRARRAAGSGALLIDDSKKLKLPNDARRHPLTHLERGVLSFLMCEAGQGDRALPANDAALLRALGIVLPIEEWYRVGPAPCPAACSEGEVRIAANVLAGALDGAMVAICVLRCEAVFERDFNELVEASGTKAATTQSALQRHLWHAWERWGAAEAGSSLRVVCDRQGGRTQYGAMLAGAFPDARVTTIEEQPARSRYEVAADGPPARRMIVQFMPEAESRHMPVALASMAAKLAREMLMARFNRYWQARMPELKPTAGYRQDGWRWLNDAAAVLTPAERQAMIRRA
ncbi:MAG: hypothetical protein KF869_01620 [Phycisphaeraceae bacterium]|nr:hypothetical protein [Phycisphaeraceae bacterium]